MSLKKTFLKSKPVCKVTFTMPADAVPSASEVHLVGEFNNWNTQADKMTQLKSGIFKLEVPLEANKSYQFKYLVNGEHWVNDEEADGFAETEFADSKNSIVNTLSA